MTQNQKAANPKGVCEKLCNIVNPFRSSTEPLLATDDHTPPIGYDPHFTGLSTQKPKKTSRKKHTFERKEIVVVDGQGNYGLAHGVLEKATPNEANEQSVHFSVETIKSKKNNDSILEETRDLDGKFSDYISEVKKKIMKTMTRINGDHDAGRLTKRRDSFNDRVTSYIDKSKIKIRTTTTIVGDEKGF